MLVGIVTFRIHFPTMIFAIVMPREKEDNFCQRTATICQQFLIILYFADILLQIVLGQSEIVFHTINNHIEIGRLAIIIDVLQHVYHTAVK